MLLQWHQETKFSVGRSVKQLFQTILGSLIREIGLAPPDFDGFSGTKVGDTHFLRLPPKYFVCHHYPKKTSL